MDGDAVVVAVAWRCSDCGLLKLRRDGDEQPPRFCSVCGSEEIREVRAINRHGEPMALTAAGRVVLGERRRFPRG